MDPNLREFWRRLQSGVEVAVAGATPDRLLGVRDGFLRYFTQALSHQEVSVAVVPQPFEEVPTGLASGDREAIASARRQASLLKKRLGGVYHFYVASEAGLESLTVDGDERIFVRNWTVVLGPVGEAWGGSGAVEIPRQYVDSWESDEEGDVRVPGTRRGGGLISSLTGGLEDRRGAVTLSTLHAVSTLFYGILRSRSTPDS